MDFTLLNDGGTGVSQVRAGILLDDGSAGVWQLACGALASYPGTREVGCRTIAHLAAVQSKHISIVRRPAAHVDGRKPAYNPEHGAARGHASICEAVWSGLQGDHRYALQSPHVAAQHLSSLPARVAVILECHPLVAWHIHAARHLCH